MGSLATPLTQVTKAHSALATSNVECYAALGAGSKYVKISAYNDTNQAVYLTIGGQNVEYLPIGHGVILDDIETESAIGVTPAADPNSGTFYVTAYTS